MVDRPGIRAIRIRKGDTVFHVHGAGEGQEGVWLAAGQVKGIYEAPVRTTWKTGAFQEGSRQKARKWLHRDMNLGFHIRDTYTAYELNESLFRQIFEYTRDEWDTDWQPTTIEVETDLSGIRKLDVLMYEAPDFDPDIDPLKQEYGNYLFKLRAGEPFWYGDDIVGVFEDEASSAAGTVTISNPTDIVAYQKFVLTRGTWTLPDQQWVGARGARAPGGPNANRYIDGIIVSNVNGGAVVDLDRQNLMFRDSNNTNMLAQLAGRFFNYAIPPYTPQTDLPVSYSGAPIGGARVEARVPQRWSRPWGLELALPDEPQLHNPVTSQIVGIGPFTYVIPQWCDTIDVLALGGAGGGNGAAPIRTREPVYDFWGNITGYETITTWVASFGGARSVFHAITLHRGSTTLPWEVTEITGSVGAGGTGGAQDQFGGNGHDTTVIVDGTTVLLADGSAGGGSNGAYGEGAGTCILNGRSYFASANAPNYGQNGWSPGGGGATGYADIPGGKGGRGEVWFYAYQTTLLEESGSESGSS